MSLLKRFAALHYLIVRHCEYSTVLQLLFTWILAIKTAHCDMLRDLRVYSFTGIITNLILPVCFAGVVFKFHSQTFTQHGTAQIQLDIHWP